MILHGISGADIQREDTLLHPLLFNGFIRTMQLLSKIQWVRIARWRGF
jgi:hypothetical protein